MRDGAAVGEGGNDNCPRAERHGGCQQSLSCGGILSVSQSLSEKVCLAQIGITHYFSLDSELELTAGKS